MASPSQIYVSTRGGSSGLSFRDVVLKGLAPDGGLFVPSEIPVLADDWQNRWKDLSFNELAFEIMSLYIPKSDIPSSDLRALIEKSYATFRAPNDEVAPLVQLDGDKPLFLLELFHGPTFAFKDVALQFVGNLFEYFLAQQNEGKSGAERTHLTVIGATSGDTGSAAIYGLRGKKDISIFILYPDGRISPIQEAQMATVPDENVHAVAIDGSFDGCQDTVKALFGDADLNSTHTLAAVNSINWARILAQITYYFSSYFALSRALPGSTPPRFVVPSGNFGDVLAGWFATRMGLPADSLVVATNENDILDRFFRSSGGYTINVAEGGGDPVRQTHAPAMDILVSSNFERLLWYLAAETATDGDAAETGVELSSEGLSKEARRSIASARVATWLAALKSNKGFQVTPAVYAAAAAEFKSERVDNAATLATIRAVFEGFKPPQTQPATSLLVSGPIVLDPHTAIGVEAAVRSMQNAKGTPHISLATAHPAKFSEAVEKAVGDCIGYDYEQHVRPVEFVGLEEQEKRVFRVRETKTGSLIDRLRALVRAETTVV